MGYIKVRKAHTRFFLLSLKTETKLGATEIATFILGSSIYSFIIETSLSIFFAPSFVSVFKERKKSCMGFKAVRL